MVDPFIRCAFTAVATKVVRDGSTFSIFAVRNTQPVIPATAAAARKPELLRRRTVGTEDPLKGCHKVPTLRVGRDT